MKTTHLLIFLFSLATIMWSCTGGQSDNATVEKEDLTANTHGQGSVTGAGSETTIVAIAAGSADHTTLVAAVKAAGLVDVLANPGPLTVFAPTNAGFAALPEGTVDNLLLPENKSSLVQVIYNHAAPGKYTTELLKDGSKLYMASGKYYPITNVDGVVTINGAKLLGTVEASNGIVYVIDEILLDPK